MSNDLADLFSVATPVAVPLDNPVTFEPLLGPDGKPATLLAWGPDSDAVRATERQITNEMMEMAARSRGRPIKPDTEKFARRRFMARIAGWDGLTVSGVSFTFTDDNKAVIWDEPKFGRIREMFETALADTSAFLASTTA